MGVQINDAYFFIRSDRALNAAANPDRIFAVPAGQEQGIPVFQSVAYRIRDLPRQGEINLFPVPGRINDLLYPVRDSGFCIDAA